MRAHFPEIILKTGRSAGISPYGPKHPESGVWARGAAVDWRDTIGVPGPGNRPQVPFDGNRARGIGGKLRDEYILIRDRETPRDAIGRAQERAVDAQQFVVKALLLAARIRRFGGDLPHRDPGSALDGAPRRARGHGGHRPRQDDCYDSKSHGRMVADATGIEQRLSVSEDVGAHTRRGDDAPFAAMKPGRRGVPVLK